MHTATVLHKLLEHSVPSIHAARLDAFLVVVQSLVQGAKASVTSLGRHLSGKAFAKHKIKRVDRLLSNAHIFGEVPEIYAALTQRLLSGLVEPIIIIDWSPLCADQSWQLLRAALPVGGRTLILYEEGEKGTDLFLRFFFLGGKINLSPFSVPFFYKIKIGRLFFLYFPILFAIHKLQGALGSLSYRRSVQQRSSFV